MSAEGATKRPLEGQSGDKDVSDSKRQVVLATKDTIKKQIEYYLSDRNLKMDEMFHKEISAHTEGYLSMERIFGCNKVKNMKKENGEKISEKDIADAIADSNEVEYKTGSGIRRKDNKQLPTFEGRLGQKPKKAPKVAHDDGVVFMVSGVEAPFVWTDIKTAVKELLVKDAADSKIKGKAFIEYCSSRHDDGSVYLSTSSFDGDLDYFKSLALNPLSVTKTSKNDDGEDKQVDALKKNFELSVCEGTHLEKALKDMPQFVKDKRLRASKKKRPQIQAITVANVRIGSLMELKRKVKEIQSNHTDGEQLKKERTDYNLIKELLTKYHPTGETKLEGEKGIKIDMSGHAGTRCFWVIKDDGSAEDFSMSKIYQNMENTGVFNKP